MKDQELVKLIQQFSYLGIFIWFAAIQLIFPIPQEIALISIGYLSTHIKIHIILSIVASAFGIVMSDTILYLLSRSGSRITEFLLSKFNSSWRKKMEGEVDQRAKYTFFILLMLPEARMLAPLIGGAMKVSYKQFIAIDIIANLILSTVYIFIGKFFYSTIKQIGGEYHKYGHFIFIAIMLLGAVVLFFIIRKKYLNEQE